MNTKLLSIGFLALLLCACKSNNPKSSDISTNQESFLSEATVRVFQLIDSAGSGHSYIYDDRTIQSEIDHFTGLIKRSTDTFSASLLQVHIDRTTEISNFLLKKQVAYSQAATSQLVAYTKPPNPCPRGGTNCLYLSSGMSFYTEDSKDSLRVISDGQVIQADTAYYDEQIKIKTIKLEQKIDGSVIRLERLNSRGEVIGTYTETDR